MAEPYGYMQIVLDYRVSIETELQPGLRPYNRVVSHFARFGWDMT